VPTLELERPDEREAWDEPVDEARHVYSDLEEVVQEPEQDEPEHGGDRQLEAAVAARLEGEDPEGDDRGDQAGREQRYAEQEVERDRRAHELGEVGGDRHHLGLEPQPEGHRSGHRVAAQLGQVAFGGDPDLRRQVLHEHGDHVGPDDHPHEEIAVPGSRGDVGGEVARVDVGDRGDERPDRGARASRARARARVRRAVASRARTRRAAGGRRRRPARAARPRGS